LERDRGDFFDVNGAGAGLGIGTEELSQ